MDVLTFIAPIIEIGLAPALLLLFVKYFFDKDKAREKQIKDLTFQFEKREDELNTQFTKREEMLRTDMSRREGQFEGRERIIVAENAQREELIKKEAEKREKLITEAAERREEALLITIDSFRDTISGFTKTMKEISGTMIHLQQKIDLMGDTLEKLK